MSEERKMILQMVSQGKITPEDAEKLLQALDDTERAARDAAAEQVHQQQQGGSGGRERGPLNDLGHTIEHAVNERLRGLDQVLSQMEFKLEEKLNDPARHELRQSMEEKIRRSVERSLERARQAEERASQAAERASERAREAAERAAERAARQVERVQERIEHVAHRAEHAAHRAGQATSDVKIFKLGIAIDKVSVESTRHLTLPAQPGDCLVLDNRVGDVRVEFYDGTEFEVEVRKQVWGEDNEDANVRSEATQIQLVRDGSNVVVAVSRPTIIGLLAFVSIQRTRTDFTIRVPHGTHLNINNKAGDTVVAGAQQMGHWHLTSKVGDVEVHALPEAGFTFDLQSEHGEVTVNMAQPVTVDMQPESRRKGKRVAGKAGEGTGQVTVSTKTGDIRITN